MQTNLADTAHHLYALYETLPVDTQQAFLEELLQKQQDMIDSLLFYLACKQAKDENEFLSDAQGQAFIDRLPR